MALKDQVTAFSPVTGWKQALGLAVVIIIVVAVAMKFGVQQKVNKTIGA